MSIKVMNGLHLNSQKITNLADGSAATDAVTKQQLDAAVQGLSWKQPVRVATTTNGALATAFANSQTVDGVVLATGDRILLKNQTTQTDNGIYTVNASGAPTRATDNDSTAEMQSATVYVVMGTTNQNLSFTQTADNVTIGSTNVVWAQVGTGGSVYVAGNGLTESPALTFNVGAGTGITVAADAISIDPTYTGLAKRFSANVGDGAQTAITVTHNLNTRDVVVSVHDAATFDEVITDVQKTTVNTVVVTFATAPASNAYRVTVIG
jgi:Coiled stalk of trimeric autotransporter adhesin